MNEYIFYANEGYTIAPNENVEVDNCQLLGRIDGSNTEDALKNLLNENSWISEAGFDPSVFFVKQILTEEQRSDINAVIDYLWSGMERNYEEREDRDNCHIFRIIDRLKGL